nr:thiamine phosphate synthase [Bacillus coahuilensis]
MIVAQKIKTICEQFSVSFIVNDDLQLATILDADGLHVGQEDGDLIDIRNRWRGILGISTHNVEEARDAQNIGADYIGVGPMYPTFSKEDHAEVKGPMMINNIRNAGIRIPLVGIGGINQENMRNVLEVGADGVAVISAISRASNPFQAALELSLSMEKIKKEN